MIKANELRIGNWVKDEEGIPYKWELEDYKEMFRYMYLANPIPITEEWLIKFGFEKNPFDYTYELIEAHNGCVYRFEFNFEEQFEFWLNDITVKIHHVHQLQNLYFALTGEELQIQK